jgi:hypothetical protein
VCHARGVEHKEELVRLSRTLVPASGQATTVQGELVRCAMRLNSEAYRNGNMNWDAGFRKMHAYLRAHLLDGSLPASEAPAVRADLAKTKSGRNPCLDLEVWGRLGDAAVRWVQAHPQPIPHAKDPALLR